MQRILLEKYLAELLKPKLHRDYCPNGLQIEGKNEINRIITGVTASLALIETAIDARADAILVHHGYFWKNEAYSIKGMKKQRIAKLLAHDINLFAYHLPLDVHPSLGNNAQLGRLLNVQNIRALAGIEPEGLVMYGQLSKKLSHCELTELISNTFNHSVTSIGAHDTIESIAWCTGGGQGYIDQVVESETQIDAFISGEISEQTTHSAREQNIDYFAIGHHVSERYGVKALGEHLQETFTDLEVIFIDIDNPA